MNARSNLIIALLTLSLIAPAAASAGSRNIPADASLPKKQPAPRLNTLKANSSTLGLGASGNWAAYVHGGASQKVAKAIAAAAGTANAATLGLGAYSNWAAYVHGGSSQKVAKAITAAAKTRTANTCASDSLRPVAC